MIVNASSNLVARLSYGESEGTEFGLVPTGAQPKDQPAAADLVDRGRLLRQHLWTVKGSARDEGFDLDL